MPGRHGHEERIAPYLLKLYSREGFLAGLHHDGEMQGSASQLLAQFVGSQIVQYNINPGRRLLKPRKRTR